MAFLRLMSTEPIISLNVGGTAFSTLCSTLTTTRDPSSIFHAMFDSNSEWKPAGKDNQGKYFFDRNPKLFEVVLEWLRTRKLNLGQQCVKCGDAGREVEFVTLEGLKGEADFFGLVNLATEVEQILHARSEDRAATERGYRKTLFVRMRAGQEILMLACLINPFHPPCIKDLEQVFVMLQSGPSSAHPHDPILAGFVPVPKICNNGRHMLAFRVDGVDRHLENCILVGATNYTSFHMNLD